MSDRHVLRFLVLFLVLVAGCTKHASVAPITVSTPAPLNEMDLIGTWTGAAQMSDAVKSKKDSGAVQRLMSSALLLISPDKTFVLTTALNKTAGTWKLAGRTLTIQTLTANDHPIQEQVDQARASGMPADLAGQIGAPRDFAVVPDGRHLVPAIQNPQANIVFAKD